MMLQISQHIFLSLLVLSVSIRLINAWPSGAPTSQCTSMAPRARNHNAQPQVLTDNDVDEFGFEGPVKLDIVFFERSKNITIFTKNQGDTFKKRPIGKFTVSRDDPFRCMNCDGKCDSITHKDRSDKTSITVKWTKPDDYNNEDLYLRYSIVTEKKKYWVGLE